MNIQFKGIIRGTYSNMQQFLEDEKEGAVFNIVGNTLESVVSGLVLPEWCYILRVNGKRIANPESYLKRKKVWHLCIREDFA